MTEPLIAQVPWTLIVAAIGVEPLWLSPAELLYRSGVTWFLARLDPVTGELTGPPTRWGTDPLFLDTPGWCNRLSHDRGIIFTSRADSAAVPYVRLMPNFVARMKVAVTEANR